MKTVFKLGLIVTGLLTWTSCENSDTDPDNYLNIPFVSTSFESHEFGDVPTDVKRNVLIEDFTGHKCGNCPGAGRKIKELQSSSPYKEQLIAVAIHANGPFNSYTVGADEYYYDFSTQEGVELDSDFGAAAAGLPKGTVNREGGPSVGVIGKNKWQASIDKYINDKPKAWVDVFATLEPGSNGNINISTRIKFLEDYPNPVNYNVILVEDHIINWQKDYSKTPDDNIPDYEHNHVLRYNHEQDNRNLFGTWGRALESHNENTDLIKRVTTTHNNTDWNVDNLEAIAYIYDANTREILQVNKVHVTK